MPKKRRKYSKREETILAQLLIGVIIIGIYGIYKLIDYLF